MALDGSKIYFRTSHAWGLLLTGKEQRVHTILALVRGTNFNAVRCKKSNLHVGNCKILMRIWGPPLWRPDLRTVGVCLFFFWQWPPVFYDLLPFFPEGIDLSRYAFSDNKLFVLCVIFFILISLEDTARYGGFF